MPVNVRWYAENEILVVEYVAPITIPERKAASGKMLAYFDAVQHPVHVIGDWRQAGEWSMVAGVTTQSLDALGHKNMGWLAVVGMSPTLENWIEVLSQLSGLRYFDVTGVEEAARRLRALS